MCLSDDNDACAYTVGFLDIGNEFRRNLLGLAPKSNSTGPVFIQKLLETEVIDEQTVTINYNPKEMRTTSQFLIGSISDELDAQVVGEWSSHKMVENEEGTLMLNLTKAIYNDKELYTDNGKVLLASIITDLMRVAGP